MPVESLEGLVEEWARESGRPLEWLDDVIRLEHVGQLEWGRNAWDVYRRWEDDVLRELEAACWVDRVGATEELWAIAQRRVLAVVVEVIAPRVLARLEAAEGEAEEGEEGGAEG